MENEEVKEIEIQNDDLNKKNYVKITPTLYIQTIPPKEEDEELKFKILNPETNVVEERPLNEEEEREIKIKELKDSRIKFHPIKHNGNITTNQFGTAYKQKRKRKNALTKKSRKANRKK